MHECVALGAPESAEIVPVSESARGGLVIHEPGEAALNEGSESVRQHDRWRAQ